MSALLSVFLLGQLAADVPPSAPAVGVEGNQEMASAESTSAVSEDGSRRVSFSFGFDLAARALRFGSIPMRALEFDHRVGVQGPRFAAFGLVGGALGRTQHELHTRSAFIGLGGERRFGRFHVGGIQRGGVLVVDRVSRTGTPIQVWMLGGEVFVGVDVVDLGRCRAAFLDGGLGADLVGNDPPILSAALRFGTRL